MSMHILSEYLSFPIKHSIANYRGMILSCFFFNSMLFVWQTSNENNSFKFHEHWNSSLIDNLKRKHID